jgi:LPXTG-site transpeptidase (sortase) family protein
MNKSEIIKYIILRTIGNFLVLFAIFGIFATFGPALYYEINYQILKVRGVKYVVEAKVPNAKPILPGTVESTESTPEITPIEQVVQGENIGGVDNFAQVLLGEKEQILIPKDTLFSIVIPKIGASTKVFANVDPSNEKEFLPVLMQGVAHAKGTVFPGTTGNIYMFAHSTDNFWDVGRYNAVFYLLKDLQPGDEIVIFFQNKRYDYVVQESKVVSPDDISHIVNAQTSGKEQLILQTCWPPGTTWQRLLVFARPK